MCPKSYLRKTGSGFQILAVSQHRKGSSAFSIAITELDTRHIVTVVSSASCHYRLPNAQTVFKITFCQNKYIPGVSEENRFKTTVLVQH
jgi:hypothetical protein